MVEENHSKSGNKVSLWLLTLQVLTAVETKTEVSDG